MRIEVITTVFAVFAIKLRGDQQIDQLQVTQRPGSHVIHKYVREVVKLKTDQTLSFPALPSSVLEKAWQMRAS